jgi:hypothetical protein
LPKKGRCLQSRYLATGLQAAIRLLLVILRQNFKPSTLLKSVPKYAINILLQLKFEEKFKEKFHLNMFF